MFFRLNGWSRKIIHLITDVIDLFFVVAIIASREQLYYSFVIFCGMLIEIIQSEWCYRKISEETNLSKIDILTKVCIYCIYKHIRNMHTFYIDHLQTLRKEGNVSYRSTIWIRSYREQEVFVLIMSHFTYREATYVV